jgi:hypothetical protein
MEIDELNMLIVDHFRHYGLRIVARVIEEEVGKVGFDAFRAPSALVM